jgi:hypothetical protein
MRSQNANRPNQNNTEAELEAAKDNKDFLKDMILVLIPTIIGAITSKFIVNSWQSRKEKNDIKREILTEYGDHVAKTFTLIGIFVERIIREIENSPIADNFKEVNLEFGYRCGDRILKEVGAIPCHSQSQGFSLIGIDYL